MNRRALICGPATVVLAQALPVVPVAEPVIDEIFLQELGTKLATQVFTRFIEEMTREIAQAYGVPHHMLFDDFKKALEL